MNRLLLLPALVLTASAALAGCASTDGSLHSDSTAKSSSAPTSKPESKAVTTAPPVQLEKATVPCTDGVAHVKDLNNKEVTVADCDTVDVSTSSARIILGKTSHLRVSGTVNGITAADLSDVTITGDGNQITSSSKPKVHDTGKKNTVHDGKR
ncbi:DUF3060 domain-containing protein [Curtobacterium sp. ER1/6]|uniref:DUF3060 domain-containing protein n=1 Tax=Curtobacterium sp. ER1/6 TaxID=1891920 RepID=UPI00084FAE29|nr:DUF3060 domain-containing protein [Curtobacterium sp. ER1/6]OEI69019.1 hypothetical protein Cus16_1514 [Curtobacterium sp. ER1/6]